MKSRKTSKQQEMPFSIGILADMVDVPKSTLRAWIEKHGLIVPVGHSRDRKRYPLFNSESARVARIVKGLREQEYGFPIIKRMLMERPMDDLEKGLKDDALVGEAG